MMLTQFIPTLFVLAILPSCRSEACDEDPELLVREFVTRMQGVHGDPSSARAAFDLLWAPAQRNLAERAARASALAGRKVAPEEMIAPTRFSLQFEPRRYTALVSGNNATVRVQSEPAINSSREVACVREDGRWRVVIELPALSAIQRRREVVHEE
jgi:hypothetical protein